MNSHAQIRCVSWMISTLRISWQICDHSKSILSLYLLPFTIIYGRLTSNWYLQEMPESNVMVLISYFVASNEVRVNTVSVSSVCERQIVQSKVSKSRRMNITTPCQTHIWPVRIKHSVAFFCFQPS